MNDSVNFSDGVAFAFWNDATKYTKTYHVAQRHPAARDDNPGTAAKPFRTINAAARVVLPGERVVVHAGLYRECVQPPRGGDNAGRMVAYEAARGEDVVLRASEAWTPACEPASNWNSGPAGAWTAPLPVEWFIGYNPFATAVMPYLPWYEWERRPHEEIRRALGPRGRIFQDGRALRWVPTPADLAKQDGAFCVTGEGTRVFFRLFDDNDPRQAGLELSVRKQCFAPVSAGTGYLRVTGFVMEHAANGVPMPQFGALSTGAGHHWIIERNLIRQATCTGLDVGWQGTSQPKWPDDRIGGHIIRRNTITDCGISGISGTKGTRQLLIEDNLIERIGGMNLERCYEAAGIKLHFAQHTLVRRNVLRHFTDACGIWLDYRCENNRVTGNVITDLQTILAGIFIEANLEPHLVDGNVIWDIRDVPGHTPAPDILPGGMGISTDVCDHTCIAHNFIGRIEKSYALALHQTQRGRVMGISSAAGRDLKALNNIVVQSPKRVLFDRLADNECDGNLYDIANANASLAVREPTRTAAYDLRGWQRHLQRDVHGAETVIEAKFDAGTLTLELKLSGKTNEPVALKQWGEQSPYGGPGPFDAETWSRLASGKLVRVRFTQRAGR
jgi:hypothetical protein